MARAATGLTEVACWQFIGAGVGGVVALIFFLVMGAMNGMDPKPKPAEIVAPIRVASPCTSWDANDPECLKLIDTIDSNLDDVKKDQLLASPCDLDVDFELVSALGFYWQAKCGVVWTGAGCLGKAGSERTDCETDMATKEASCAFLGLSQAPMSLMANDVDDPDTCQDYFSKENTVTQGQADRCATSPSMAWETLMFMTGGDMVNTHRCSAVTFAAIVAQGKATPVCTDTTAYNYNAADEAEEEANAALCQNRRVCDPQVLSELINEVDNGLSTNTAGHDSTWSWNGATQVETTTCVEGWEAKDGTADYFCSHLPYTDDAGFPIASDGTRLADASASIGKWVGELECQKRACPAQCGSDLGAQITGESGRSEPRAPPEGLTDTCCSGVFGDTCQIRCERGYSATADPLTCQVVGGDSQATPQWSGASCTAMQCLDALVGWAVSSGSVVAQGAVGETIDHRECEDDNHMQVGEIACQSSLLIQGGGCKARPAVAPIPAPVPAATGASSNIGQSELVFDNDPMTYWYSTERARAQDAPVWVEVTLPSAVVPLGVSIQLGKSTDFNSHLIKPTEWKFQAWDSTGGTDGTGDWDPLVEVANNLPPNGVVGVDDVAWNPPCNDKSVDPFSCNDDSTAFYPCPESPNRCGNVADPSDCRFPNTYTCGPTEFPIAQMDSKEYTRFRMHITGEETQYDGTTPRTERYGTIYIQDIAIMTPSTIRKTVGGNTFTFTPLSYSCCGATGECPAGTNLDLQFGQTTYAECVSLVAAQAAGASGPSGQMQFSREAYGAGVGQCYYLPDNVPEADRGPAIVTETAQRGAMCWSVTQA